MVDSYDLKNYCHVNTDEGGDNFVGVKGDSAKVMVYFPLGYQLPDDNKVLGKEIRRLFSILYIFNYKKDEMIRSGKLTQSQSTEFPILAFLNVLDYFMENNGHYYIETEKRLRTDTKGKINWKKTIKNQKAFIKDNQLAFTKFSVEYKSPLNNQLITQIHKYCVYEAYQRLGWLYTSQRMSKPELIINDKNKRIAIQELNKKYSSTNNERNKLLFKSMKSMLEYIDDRNVDKSFHFGTKEFEYVWEKLIDRVFGISSKDEYFPKGVWMERDGSGEEIEKSPLQPDSIMICRDSSGKEKIYVLDAKYYRYGQTHNSNHLPDSSSISKQITYGEYIKDKKGKDNDQLFNAFIMPYNSLNNSFNTKEKFVNVAEAYGRWRANEYNYEKIQGILVDVRYILLNYLGNHDEDKRVLAECIERYL